MNVERSSSPTPGQFCPKVNRGAIPTLSAAGSFGLFRLRVELHRKTMTATLQPAVKVKAMGRMPPIPRAEVNFNACSLACVRNTPVDKCTTIPGTSVFRERDGIINRENSVPSQKLTYLKANSRDDRLGASEVTQMETQRLRSRFHSDLPHLHIRYHVGSSSAGCPDQRYTVSGCT